MDFNDQYILLDRDGVVNTAPVNRYITNPAELTLLDGVAAAMRRLNDHGYRALVVSNQQCIGKGIITSSDLDAISAHLSALVEAGGGRILDYFYCPHLAEEACDCRKPRPGLIRHAQQKHGFDPAKTYLIGDSYKDLEAAHAYGCPSILVLTGNDADRYRSGDAPVSPPKHVARNLLEAVEHVLGNDG